MEHEIEIQVMPSGNVAVYCGSAFIRTEELTEEEKEFIIDRIANELGVNTKGDRETFAEHYGCISETDNNRKEAVVTRDSALKDEIKRYTEEMYHETFGNGQRTYDEFDWEDIAVTIEETAVHFVGWKEKALEYKTISKILALGFMHYLDNNRQEGKMCLSSAECEDITKAVSEQDWKKLERYAEKYTRHFAEWGVEHAKKEQPAEGLEEELKRYINSDEYINTRGSGILLIARHFAEYGAKHLKR